MPPEGKSSWILCNKADIMYIDIPTSVHKLRVIRGGFRMVGP